MEAAEKAKQDCGRTKAEQDRIAGKRRSVGGR